MARADLGGAKVPIRSQKNLDQCTGGYALTGMIELAKATSSRQQSEGPSGRGDFFAAPNRTPPVSDPPRRRYARSTCFHVVFAEKMRSAIRRRADRPFWRRH